MAKKLTKALAAKVRKAKFKTKRKAKDTATLSQLQPIAIEINVRLMKASSIEAKADDHRLAAALQLAKAKKLCDKQKLNFKTWATANLDQSYETIRKLSYIGVTKNPAQVLADIRSGQRQHSENTRQRITAKKKPEGASTEETITPFARATSAIKELDEKASINLVSGIAAAAGMRIIPEAELKALRVAEKKPAKEVTLLSIVSIREAFGELAAHEKMQFVTWAAEQISVKIVAPDFDEVEDRPEFLDRAKKHGGKRKPRTVKRGAKA